MIEPAQARASKMLLPDRHAVYGGAARVWWPGVREDSDPFHPVIFDPTGVYGEDALERLAREFRVRSPQPVGLSPQQQAVLQERLRIRAESRCHVLEEQFGASSEPYPGPNPSAIGGWRWCPPDAALFAVARTWPCDPRVLHTRAAFDEAPDIADKLGLSRSTTHRYATTLVALGFLEQSPSRRYRLGPRVIDLGMTALNSTGLREHAHPYLEELRKQSSYTVNLAVLDGTEILCVDRVRSFRREQSKIDLGLRPGSRLPAYCTAMGKLLWQTFPSASRASCWRS